jgi:predicted transcriptional regulator of viral defense system
VNPLKLLQSHFKDAPFSPKDINELGITQAQLIQLLHNESIHRLSRGVYVLSGADLSDEAQFRAATMRIDGPSAVCLVSALAYYGITDHIPKKVWLLVPEDKHSAHKDLRLLRSRNPKWKVGIDSHKGYKITNIERSIVDALTTKRALGFSIGVSALKSALQNKKTSLDKIIKMATQLGVDHRVMSYIEALS